MRGAQLASGEWPWPVAVGGHTSSFQHKGAHRKDRLLLLQLAGMEGALLRHSSHWSGWRMEFALPNPCAICSELKTTVSSYNYQLCLQAWITLQVSAALGHILCLLQARCLASCGSEGTCAIQTHLPCHGRTPLPSRLVVFLAQVSPC